MNDYTASAAWPTAHTLRHETDAIRLLEFSDGDGTAMVIIPPQAGHHSCIADYGPGQSLVESAADHYSGSVYCIEWKSCTHERRKEGVADLLLQLDSAVLAAGGRATLVGLCQGGWLAVIYAALYPERVASLVIAGAPIDTKAGKSKLHAAQRLPMLLYQAAVMMDGGLMKGRTMLKAWKSSDPIKHHLAQQGPSAETTRFYSWYNHTQDIAGGWYLWAIEHLFQANNLSRNKLTVNGHHVDLAALKLLDSVHIVTGEKDDITPPMQSHALLLHVGAEVYSVNSGHIGVFMGRRGIKSVWSPLFAEMGEAA